MDEVQHIQWWRAVVWPISDGIPEPRPHQEGAEPPTETVWFVQSSDDQHQRIF